MILLALAAATLLGSAIFVTFVRQGPSGNFTISPAGKQFEIGPGGAAGLQFRLTSNGSITGSFKSNGSIIAYVLSTPDFYNFPRFLLPGNKTGVFYSMAPTTSGSLDAILSSGTYYLVFYNPSSAAGAEVQVTDDIVAHGSGNFCQQSC